MNGLGLSFSDAYVFARNNGRPAFLLDFAQDNYSLSGVRYGTLADAGVTFSRGTNATMIDSTGKLTYAPSNLLRNSESLKGTGWNLFGGTPPTVTSNVAVAPDGTTTADLIVLPVGSGIFQNVTSATVGVNYSVSWWIRADAPTTVRLLSNTDTSVLVSTTCSVTTEWQRFSLVRVLPAGATVVTAQIDQGVGATIYAWGAQLEAVTYETAPRAYNSTTPKNLLGFTEEFDNAAWGRTNIGTITANSTVAPNGTTTADEISDNATVGQHQVVQNISIVIGTVYTLSYYVKNNTARYARVTLGGLFNFTSAAFDLELGIVQAGSSASAAITSVGNGWFRVSINSTAASTGTTGTIAIGITNSTGTAYGGPGNTLFFWGAQVSDSASLDPYVYNPAAAPTSTVYYGPRFDYDPNFVYSTNNLIPYANPQDFSNNAFWVKARATAPATTATADPTGTYTAYKLTENVPVVPGTPETHLIQWQGVNTAVTAGVQYTFSGYVKLADAARPSVQVNIGADNGAFTVSSGDINLTTGVVSSPVGTAPIVTDAGNGWWRWSITATAIASALFVVRVYLIAGVTNVYIGDGTSGAYIWGAQMVAGSAAVPFFYYPYTPLGLLIEEARTNLLLNSATLSTQIVTTTAQSYTLSFYGTGTVTLTGTSIAGPLVGTGAFPNRASLTFTATAGALTLTVSGTVSNAQFEAGGFATSYIPTAGASATRSADVATMVGNNFSNWYNQTTGTFAVTFDASANGGTTYISASNGSIVQNSVHIDNQSGNMRAAYRSGSAEVAAIVLGAIGTAGTTNKIATAYAVNDFAASRNGVLGTSDTSGALPVSLTQLNIGVDDRLSAIYYTSNHIKSIAYYNTRLPNSQLQAMTA